MEIALMDGGKWLRPGRGDPADHYWNSDDVAGYVPVAEIDALLSRIDSGMCVPVPRGGLY